MFEYIHGKLVENTPQLAVIDIGGIGYKVFVPMNYFQKLPPTGSLVLLYTYLAIRENDHSLYGFISKQERELFCKLIDVSGIGPKTALSMLGHIEHTNLISSIRQSNVSELCRVPGIGKKTAERLILEIKDKLPDEVGELFAPFHKLSMDAAMALIHLGYSPIHAEKAVKTALKNEAIDDLGILITEALKHCS